MGRLKLFTIILMILTHLRHSYVELDEEFVVSDSDWKWLLSHTEYSQQDLQCLLQGQEVTESEVTSYIIMYIFTVYI